MPRRDFIRILIIGGAVGLLIQPILANNLSAHAEAYITPLVRLVIFLFFLIAAPFVLWLVGMISQKRRGVLGIYQFAQFASVGTMNSFIDVCVFNLETALYGTSFIGNGLFAAFKAISFLFGTTNSFIWNKYWTFGSQDKTNASEVGAFYGVAFVGWIINVGTATIIKSVGPIDSRAWVNIVAPLAGIGASFIWNFLGYKFWVFKKPG